MQLDAIEGSGKEVEEKERPSQGEFGHEEKKWYEFEKCWGRGRFI